MKKVSLNIDALKVTSFTPGPDAQGTRGTVQGHATLRDCPSRLYGTFPCNTCEMASCVETCTYPDGNLC